MGRVLRAISGFVLRLVAIAFPLLALAPEAPSDRYALRMVACVTLAACNRIGFARPSPAKDRLDRWLQRASSLALLLVYWCAIAELSVRGFFPVAAEHSRFGPVFVTHADVLVRLAGDLLAWFGVVLMAAATALRMWSVPLMGARHPHERATLAVALGACLLLGSWSGLFVLALVLVPLVVARVRRAGNDLVALHGEALHSDAVRTSTADEPPLWSVRRWRCAPTVVDLAVIGALVVGALEVGVWLLWLVPATWAVRGHRATNPAGLAAWCGAWLGVAALPAIVVPAFVEVYRDVGMALPSPTLLLINLCDLVTHPGARHYGAPLVVLVGYASAALIAWDGARTGLFIVPGRYLVPTVGVLVSIVAGSLGLPLTAEVWCVAAGTPIATPEGPRPIEALAVGDAVVIRDANGGLAVGHVARVRRGRAAAYRALHLDDGSILRVTDVHPIATGRGWVRARALREGDVLRQLDGWCRLGEIEECRGPIDVIDLTIEGAPNFHAAGVLVHNKLG